MPVVTISQKKPKHYPYQTRKRTPRATAASKTPVSTPQPKPAQQLKYAPWWNDESRILSKKLPINSGATHLSGAAPAQLRHSHSSMSWCSVNRFEPLESLNINVEAHDDPPEAYHLQRASLSKGSSKRNKPLQSGMSQHQKKICKRSKNELQSDQFINAARVRVHPTSDQKECLKRYFGISCVIWNEGLDLIYKC
ncbi:hypothetical protein MP638_003472 [Amoeboaphelidium occidentale]|nr:hypothetical protein MP638_003472 [Amoeboaphelidium occidentale]